MKNFLIAITTLFLVSSCEPSYMESSEKRAKIAAGASAKQDIVIGIAHTSVNPNGFLDGVFMAIEEVNRDGGIFGRQIRPIVREDNGSDVVGREIAVELAKNPDVIAVVGHRYSSVAIPASIIYEANGILFISPGATHPHLTRSDSRFIFRNIPSDVETGREAANFAHRNNYKKMAIIFDSESIGKRLAEVFYKHANNLGIRITAHISYVGMWEQDFRPLVADLMNKSEFDAIFLGAGGARSAAKLVTQMRDMGITVPILGGDTLDTPRLLNIAGKAAEGTIVSTVFDPGHPSSVTQNFVKRFETRYNVSPDTWAALGYDAIRVLAFCIRENGSTVPLAVSTTMRFLRDWQGVAGAYSFTSDGNITGKALYFKKVEQGEFRFLERELREEINPFEAIEDITLRLPIEGSIPTIDPGLTEDVTSIEATEQLFLGLTDFDPETYQPVPELAVEWEVCEDGKGYLFHLRQDAKWTDGAPVTAYDVVWAIQRNINPETKSPFANMLYILKNARAIHSGEISDISEIGVYAINEFTVEFELEYAASYFPAMAGLYVYRPLPQHIIEMYGDQWTEPANIETSGSYRLMYWQKGIMMILRKNLDYYDAENVRIPEVRYYVIPESSVGLTMYENNQLDILGDSYLRIPMAEIPNILTDPILSREYSQASLFCPYAYIFNTKLPPVDNVLVRKAITAAIDRKLIVQLVTKGNQSIATTYTPPPVFGSVDPKENIGIRFDPVQAKKWLAEAGYPDGKGFPEIKFLYNESETHGKIAKAIQKFLKYYLNIDAIPQAQSYDDYAKSRTEFLPEATIRFGYCADYPDANNFLHDLFHPLNSDNIARWDNSEFTELIDQARIVTNPLERKKLYRRAEQILCEEECVVVPIYFETGHFLIKPRVKGWYNMPLGGQHIRNWYF